MVHRVLIVDDDVQLREMMAELLTFEGFDVEVACNGQDALDKARAHTPRVIVLDMMMPVMDGWTFCARQRGDAVLVGIPVVILSAAPMELLTNLGAAAVLLKPFEYPGLISAVRANC
jgi:two-component system chemotaxis response regulator CheY